jgi:acetyl esterase/lipase
VSPDQYPAQEPFTAIGAKYHDEVLRRGADVEAVELAYGADPYQRIAIVPAQKPSGDVLVALHGGGWTNGYKEWMLFMAPALTGHGVTFVSAGYRLAPQHIFPAGFEDVLDAVAATHKAVAAYGGKPGRIFITGHSAGGHLAALAALRGDWATPRNLPANVIRGALPISGSYDFGEGSGFSMRPRFLGAPDSGAEKAASPIQYVRNDAPPFFIAWGENDFPHLRKQAEDFAAALRAAGIEVETMVLPGCDHLGASYESADPQGRWVKAAARWMREH